MYTVNLIRERASENETWVDTFQVEDFVVNPEQAIRNAVEEYLSTEAGKDAISYTCHDFNWGDAVTYVPEEIWNKHGLKFQYIKSIEIKVNQDEVLCGDCEEEEE